MPAPGPADPTRSAEAGDLLELAGAAARDAGVTRLAEITRLDCLGLPVWQAVRPMSRALSVHMGKGSSDDDARLGALMEALESHHAERFDAEGPRCRADALSSVALADCADDRDRPLDSERIYRWVEAEELSTGKSSFLPFDFVSLDLTRDWDSPFDRSSNGLAAGPSRDEAIAVALHEVIERDAVTEWRAGGILGCMACALDTDGITFGWFREWAACLDEAGIAARFYRVPSITGTPVIACELADPGKEGAPYSAVQGFGCHPLPEIALFKALAEAIQCRATAVAGAREDLPPSAYRSKPGVIPLAFGLPLPPGRRGIGWDSVAEAPAGIDALLSALAEAGYPQAAALSLASLPGIEVVKVHIPGLGGLRRRRRPPLP